MEINMPSFCFTDWTLIVLKYNIICEFCIEDDIQDCNILDYNKKYII